jgi:hypothetical protein
VEGTDAKRPAKAVFSRRRYSCTGGRPWVRYKSGVSQVATGVVLGEPGSPRRMRKLSIEWLGTRDHFRWRLDDDGYTFDFGPLMEPFAKVERSSAA